MLKELDGLNELQPWEVEEEDLKKEVNDEKAPIELKMLPSTLKYVFLDETEAKPVIISNLLSNDEEARLINVLKKIKKPWVGLFPISKELVLPIACTRS